MRLIDADELKRKYAKWYNVTARDKSIRCVETKEIDWMPTITAVPLDKLSNLLNETESGVPCVLCEKIIPGWCAKHKPSECPTWETVLTKWMEEAE